MSCLACALQARPTNPAASLNSQEWKRNPSLFTLSLADGFSPLLQAIIVHIKAEPKATEETLDLRSWSASEDAPIQVTLIESTFGGGSARCGSCESGLAMAESTQSNAVEVLTSMARYTTPPSPLRRKPSIAATSGPQQPEDQETRLKTLEHTAQGRGRGMRPLYGAHVGPRSSHHDYRLVSKHGYTHTARRYGHIRDKKGR